MEIIKKNIIMDMCITYVKRIFFLTGKKDHKSSLKIIKFQRDFSQWF